MPRPLFLRMITLLLVPSVTLQTLAPIHDPIATIVRKEGWGRELPTVFAQEAFAARLTQFFRINHLNGTPAIRTVSFRPREGLTRRWVVRLAAALVPAIRLWGQDQSDPLKEQILAEINRLRRAGATGSNQLAALLSQPGGMPALVHLFVGPTADSTHQEVTRYLSNAVANGWDPSDLLKGENIPALVASRMDERTAGMARVLLEEGLKRQPEHRPDVLGFLFEDKQLAELRQDEEGQNKIATVLNELGTVEDFLNLYSMTESPGTVLRQVETNSRFSNLHLREGVLAQLLKALVWPSLRRPALQALEAIDLDEHRSPDPAPTYSFFFSDVVKLYRDAILVGDHDLADALESWILRVFQQPDALEAFSHSMGEDAGILAAGLQVLKKSDRPDKSSDLDFVAWLMAESDEHPEVTSQVTDLLSNAILTSDQKDRLAENARRAQSGEAARRQSLEQMRKVLADPAMVNSLLEMDVYSAHDYLGLPPQEILDDLFHVIADENDSALHRTALNLFNHFGSSSGTGLTDVAAVQAITRALDDPTFHDLALREIAGVIRGRENPVIARALLLKAISLGLLIDLPKQTVDLMELMLKLAATRDTRLDSQMPTSSEGLAPFDFVSDMDCLVFLLQLLAYDLSPEQRAGVAHTLFRVTSVAYNMVHFPEGFFAAVGAVARYGNPEDLQTPNLTLFLPYNVGPALLDVLLREGLPLPKDVQRLGSFLFFLEQAEPSLRMLMGLAEAAAQGSPDVYQHPITLQRLLRIVRDNGQDADTVARRSEASKALARITLIEIEKPTLVEALLTELLLCRAEKNAAGEAALTQAMEGQISKPAARSALQDIVNRSADEALRDEARQWLARSVAAVHPRGLIASRGFTRRGVLIGRFAVTPAADEGPFSPGAHHPMGEEWFPIFLARMGFETLEDLYTDTDFVRLSESIGLGLAETVALFESWGTGIAVPPEAAREFTPFAISKAKSFGSVDSSAKKSAETRIMEYLRHRFSWGIRGPTSNFQFIK